MLTNPSLSPHMPPRKGIVKSGNAGNSSKPSKEAVVEADKSPPPLFPPGSKYPLSLLQERFVSTQWLSTECGSIYIGAQKMVGRSPLSTLFSRFPLCLAQQYSRLFQPKRGEGWAFVVVLARIVKTKNGQDRQSVRMEPRPPYVCKSALEARHWGATYALYRVRLLLTYVLLVEANCIFLPVLQRHPAQPCSSSRASRLLGRAGSRT